MKNLTGFGNIIIDKKIIENFERNAFLTSDSQLIIGDKPEEDCFFSISTFILKPLKRGWMVAR